MKIFLLTFGLVVLFGGLIILMFGMHKPKWPDGTIQQGPDE